MAIVKRGSIVLINYPFSDLSNNKVRPALIIMSDDLLKKTDDILCIFISSAIYKSTLPSDFELKKKINKKMKLLYILLINWFQVFQTFLPAFLLMLTQNLLENHFIISIKPLSNKGQ